jgi:hypothetical protein
MCAAALALAAAERLAQRQRQPAAALAAPSPRAAVALPGPWLLAAALLAALAFQCHTSLNAAAQFRRFVPAEALAWWLPVFWIGFNLALWPAMKLAPRLGAVRLVAVAALVAAAAAWAGNLAPSLGLLAAAQAVAGLAWAAMLAGGFTAALALGHGGREGRFSGAVSSSLAGAALLRLALVTSGAGAALRADGAPWADALPALLWALSAGMLWRASGTAPAATGRAASARGP